MIRGGILDVDGTVVRGDEALPGARTGLDLLDSCGVRRLFVSNNPTKPPAAYEARFARAGFDVSRDEVLTAATVTTDYLTTHHADEKHFVIGESGLRTLMTEAGIEVVDDPDAASVLVVSIDREFHFDDLCVAMQLLDNDAVAFVGTDPDMVIPAAGGEIPGSGAVIHAIAGVVGRDPDVVLGKPSKPAQELVTARLGLPPEQCLVVGDRLDTDIAFGKVAEMTTALVTTGITDERTLAASDIDPDYVLDSLAALSDVAGLG